MPTLQASDIFETSVRYDGDVLVELTRRYHVTDMVGTAASGFDAALATAGLPQIWDAHPGYPTYMFCLQRNPAPSGPKSCYIDCVYYNTTHTYDNGGGALAQVRTDKESQAPNAPQIVVEHRGIKQTGTISVLLPEQTLSLGKIVKGHKYTGGVKPWILQANYVNTINQNPLRDFSPFYWLMENISYSNNRFGLAAYDVEYTIRGRIGGWNTTEAVWIDPETGEPGRDLVPGVGRKAIPWHVAVDWTALGLEAP